MAITWKDVPVKKSFTVPPVLFQVGHGMSGYANYDYNVFDTADCAATATADLSADYLTDGYAVYRPVTTPPDATINPTDATSIMHRINRALSHTIPGARGIAYYFTHPDSSVLAYVECVSYRPGDDMYPVMYDVWLESQD